MGQRNSHGSLAMEMLDLCSKWVTKYNISRHMTSKQRRINVDAMSWCNIDFNLTLFHCHVSVDIFLSVFGNSSYLVYLASLSLNITYVTWSLILKTTPLSILIFTVSTVLARPCKVMLYNICDHQMRRKLVAFVVAVRLETLATLCS